MSNGGETVEILMATYNGERYLKEQINSILAQTYTNWNLIVQDDCSTDGTPRLLLNYQKQYPGKITVIPNFKRFGSAQSNFFSLLFQSTAAYVMACDQDDVWLPNKIMLTMQKTHEMEKNSSTSTPLLVHTDLAVTDAVLETISPSLFYMQKMDASRTALRQLLAQNIVTGCTMMVNRPLLDILGKKEPQGAIMHDWWLALLVNCTGRIGFVDEPTILYRQHGENAIGARNARSLWHKLRLLRDLKQVRKNITATYLQAQCFLELYEGVLNRDQRLLLTQYAGIPLKNKMNRCLTAWRLGTVKHGTVRKISSIIYL